MSQIERLLGQFQESFQTNDVDRLMEIYHEDVMMFDCWQYWSYEGKDAVRTMVVYWLNEIKDEKAAFEISDLKVHKDQEMEFATFDARIILENQESTVRSETKLRYTVCAVCDGEWKIKHQHSSQPIE